MQYVLTNRAASGTQVGKASHTPLIHKERIIGDWEINGTEPPYVWQIGGGNQPARTEKEPQSA